MLKICLAGSVTLKVESDGSMMRKRMDNKMQSVLRLLTLVCFLNFSGVNNGFAYVTIISPPDVAQSLTFGSNLFNDLNSSITPSGIVASARWGFGLATRLSLKLKAMAHDSSRLITRSLRTVQSPSELWRRALLPNG